ncbi:DUF3592 domain-containing protein [Arthrobacter sp. ISL-72]|uniref:DUF3592 domain-containing protein n=1 Tax=Arthrobacter sp. ISL-72 TaxID=2819114 RepID=UPI002889355E|nr:DUF3592 domain-containing protein [Arthrobacter sp. ISL-72]
MLYIIWSLFVVAATAACSHAVRKTKRRERLIDAWPKVQATVTGSRAGWTSSAGNTTRSRRYWPTYQFAGPEGDLHSGESEVSYAEQPVTGSPLEVAYNPNDPGQSFQVASPSKQVLGCLIPFFAVFAVVSFWFIGLFPLD